VLGCTHYPLLRDVIEAEVRDRIGPHVTVVDSAHATAADVGAFLLARGLACANGGARPPVQLLVTDVPASFRDAARRFLGEEVDTVEQVDL
jgi:glutamate racemase